MHRKMGPIPHGGYVLKEYVRTFQFCYRHLHQEAGHPGSERPGREVLRLPTTRSPTRAGKVGLFVCATSEGSGQMSRKRDPAQCAGQVMSESQLVRVVY